MIRVNGCRRVPLPPARITPFTRGDANRVRWRAVRESEHERTPAEEYGRVPEILEGEDEGFRDPPAPIDPYTPEPGARPGERRAFRVMLLAFVAIAVVVAIVIYAAVR